MIGIKTGIGIAQHGTKLNLPENITVVKNDDYVYLRTAYSEEKDVVQKLFIGISDISFSPGYTTFLIAKSDADTVFAYEAGTLIHINPDDAAPIHLNTSYIGAAHGLSNLRVVAATLHGKTVQDVGSEWIDGGGYKHYIIKIVNENTLWILAENLHRDWYPKWYMRTSITGNLTHSAGATNTGAITISSSVAGQLLPAIKNKTLSVKLNGSSAIIANGTYKANNVVVDEYYEVVNPSDSLLFIQENVGSATQPAINTGEVMFTQETKYTYFENSVCLVYNKFTPKQIMDFDYYGFFQSSPLYVSGALSKLNQYIPKSLPITISGTPYDFREIKDITTMPATANFTNTYWENANDPPERSIQFLANSSNERQVGFSMGLFKGKGVESNRKDKVTNAFSIATSKKQYPHGIDSKITLVNDTVYEGYVFRAYFDPTTLPSGKIAEKFVKSGSETYLYLDYNSAVTDVISIPTEYRGKTITLMDKSENVSCEDFVTGETLTVEVTEATPNYGYLVLKLT